MQPCFLASMIPSKKIQQFFFPLIPLFALQDIQNKILKNKIKSKTTIGPRLFFAS
jgi:hypothetical protein